MGEACRIARRILERAACQRQTVGRNADAVCVHLVLVRENGVSEDQVRGATARGIGRLYGGPANQQRQGRPAAADHNGGGLAHRDRDADHIIRVQGVVGNPRGASDGNASDSVARAGHCQGAC